VIGKFWNTSQLQQYENGVKGLREIKRTIKIYLPVC